MGLLVQFEYPIINCILFLAGSASERSHEEEAEELRSKVDSLEAKVQALQTTTDQIEVTKSSSKGSVKKSVVSMLYNVNATLSIKTKIVRKNSLIIKQKKLKNLEWTMVWVSH